MDLTKKTKRQVIAAHTNAETEEDIWIKKHFADASRTLEDDNIIKPVLKEVSSFSSLNESEILALCNAMRRFAFKKGENVVQEGMDGSHFFVIASGIFGVYIGGEFRKNMERGTAFGDFALLYNCPRTATIRAETDGAVWGLPRAMFREVLKFLSERNFEENLAFLASVSAFDLLTKSQKSAVCSALIAQTFQPGQVITAEGGVGDSLYFVKEGIVDVSIKAKGGHVRYLEKGSYFGERALLYDEPRSATITAVNAPVTVLCLTREEIERRLGSNLQLVLYSNVLLNTLQNSPVFGRLAIDQQQRIVKSAAILEYNAGHVILDPTTESCYLIVLEGSVSITPHSSPSNPMPLAYVDAGAPIAPITLPKGGGFGECYALHRNGPVRHTVTAAKPCRLGVLVPSAFETVLGAGLNRVLDTNSKIQALKRVYVFRYLSESQLLAMVNSFQSLTQHKGDEVISQGDQGERFFVIEEGEVAVSKDQQHIRTCGRFDYIGERALLFDEPRSATVTAVSDVVKLWVIDKSVFNQIVKGSTMREHLVQRIALQDTQVQMNDLNVLRIVGRGTFGTVKLVQHRKTGTRYALKCIKRATVAQLNQQSNIKLEREILAENDHPFIVKLVKTFKDPRYLYFLTELITGGELYDAIRKLGLLNRPQAQFYFSSIMMALENLHSRSIAYRDLKPENVMLDHQGYVKLIDFGCAKKLFGRSTTLVGTPHYMAPEVIRSRGYGVVADLWSLGVCLYEFVCGPLPFGNDAEDQLEVFRDILSGQLVFPNYLQDQDAISMIRGLLTKHEGARLGAANGMREVREHAYLSDFNLEHLLSRQLAVPLTPKGESYAEDAEEGGGKLELEKEDTNVDDVGAAAPGDWDKDF